MPGKSMIRDSPGPEKARGPGDSPGKKQKSSDSKTEKNPFHKTASLYGLLGEKTGL